MKLVEHRLPLWLAASMLFVCCENRQSSELKDIKKGVDVIGPLTMNIQGRLTSLEQPTYLLNDIEHGKIVGALKQTPPPQVGTFVIWDDDVYEVEAIRLHSEKLGDEKINETTVKRTALVELFVKFVSKVTPSDKTP